MPEDKILLNCYNRGCGQKFNPGNNDKDECRHHPGMPFFHDAYKGWSCCNKKCTDFTEFLNIKGCSLSKHSNEKPPEPVKPTVDKEKLEEVIEVKAPAPIIPSTVKRPPFDSPLVNIQPNIADSLKEQTNNLSQEVTVSDDSGEVEIGTSCKNGGCRVSYEGSHSNDSVCTYHPGSPVFHEGLKFWTCCQKRTTDFNTFLNQPGCTTGVHKWRKEAETAGTVKCRWDWHQTPDFVIISIYAKLCHPTKSSIKANPIRLNTKLVFPKEADASFEIDLELRGVIDVEKSSAAMTPSKVEIKLKKFEPGSWSKLDFPRPEDKKPVTTVTPAPDTKQEEEDDLVDLSSVEAVQSIGKVNISEVTE